MMLTRCPTCGTTFRVTPEQLKARQGQVRCGQCRQVFNAINALIEDTAAPAPQAPTPAAESAWAVVEPVREDPRVIRSRAEPALEADFQFPHASHAPEPRIEPAFETPKGFEPVPAPEPPPSAPEFVPLPKLPDIDDFDTAADITIEPPLPEPDPEPEPQPEPEPEPAPEPEPELEQESEPEYSDPETLLVFDEAAEPATELPAEPKPERALPRFSARFPMPPEPHLDVEPERVYQLHDVPEPRRRWPWVLGSLIALVALTGQALLHFRAELINASPESRPIFVAACQLFGCKIELPHKVEFIGIETSDLSPDNTTPGRLHLAATLRNRAAFAQTWPNLEVTLTDANERPLLRRVLAPTDYLPAKTSLTDGFPRRGDLAVQLTLEVTDVPAVGYRLYVFYP
jgi:predicted Zn finger-like uncharacterized protein